MGQTQNLDKQEMPKLLVAQTVPGMRVAFDDAGVFYANKVRVNGILPQADNGWFLLGVFNSPTVDFVFRCAGKPKDNGYFEAKKQFIAPLPVPSAAPSDRAEIARLARALQSDHTERMRLMRELDAPTARVSLGKHQLDWLLPGIRSVPVIEAELARPRRSLVPRKGKERRDFVNRVADLRDGDETAAFARVAARLRTGSRLAAAHAGAAVLMTADGVEIARAYVADAAAPLVLA